MDILQFFKKLSPFVKSIVFVLPFLILLVASNTGLLQNMVHLLQVIPPIVYVPIYVTEKRGNHQAADASKG
jgi:hypothetical protein